METIEVKIKGTVLLLHNGQLADPANPYAKALAAAVKNAKSKKTEAAYEAAYKAEFDGCFYLDEKGEPCIPGEVLEAMIVEGAKSIKEGPAAKAGVIVEGNWPLEYKGPRDRDALWKAGFYKKASAKIGRVRVMRTRPIFTDWSLRFIVHFNPETVGKKSLIEFIERAGAEKGIGDWRPRHGRFEVVK